MATAIKMPQLGITMTEAKVIAWLKQEGDAVEKGDPVATIETDKINAEVEASASGVLRRIVAQEGAVVPVVGLLAVIGAPDEPDAAIDAVVSGGPAAGAKAPASRNPAPAAPATSSTSTAPAAPAAPAAPVGAGGGVGLRTSDPGPRTGGTGAEEGATVRASPIARRVASELQIDLGAVQGSGPGGRIVEADVRAAATETATATATPGATAPPAAPGGENGFVRASPLARRLAREQGLDLLRLTGTGPQGRIVERDVLGAVAALAAAPAAPGAEPPDADSGLTRRETVPLDGIRRVVADRMWESLQRTAQLTLTMEADATALVDLRGHLVPAAKVYGHRPPTYTDLLVFLVARVLPRHPLLNSSLIGEGAGREIAVWQEINLGVAVALERGLVVPVLKGADQKPLQTISQELAGAAERARAGRLEMADLAGGTFTITNLGQMEVEYFTPIINPPQAAILGVGRILKKPAVVGDEVVARQMLPLSLTFDHRVVDGAPAGAFLRDVKHAIEAATLEG